MRVAASVPFVSRMSATARWSYPRVGSASNQAGQVVPGPPVIGPLQLYGSRAGTTITDQPHGTGVAAAIPSPGGPPPLSGVKSDPVNATTQTSVSGSIPP